MNDGRIGEIFIDMHKEGGGARSFINNFAIAVSLGCKLWRAAGGYVERLTFTPLRAGGPVQGNRQHQKYATRSSTMCSRTPRSAT